MGIGAGFIGGTGIGGGGSVPLGSGNTDGSSPGGGLYGVRPGDTIRTGVSGLTYHQQDEGGNGNVAFYEVNAAGDYLDFQVPEALRGYEEVAVTLFTVFGSTDFDVQNKGTAVDKVSEQSGFDSDVWILTGSIGGEELRVTQFDDTQAGLYPYVAFGEVQS